MDHMDAPEILARLAQLEAETDSGPPDPDPLGEPVQIDLVRWLRGACSSGDPLRNAVVGVCDELDAARAEIKRLRMDLRKLLARDKSQETC